MERLPMRICTLIRLCLVSCAGLLLSACATTTNVDYRQGYDFAAIHNIRINDPSLPTSSDPRINSPLVDQRVRTAITDYLTAHGYHIVASGEDARLAYQITTKSGVEGNNSGVSFGFGNFSHNSAVGVGYGFPGYDVDSYDEAVLTIDILDKGDGSLLWRGSSSRRLNDGNTPVKTTEMVNGLVTGVLGNFPPGRKQ
jgi:hypothetical protein